MQIIQRERGGGKTTEAVKIVKQNNGVLICRNKVEVERVMRRHGLTKDQAITWEMARQRDWFRGRDFTNRPIVLEDVEFLLAEIFGQMIDAVTTS